MLPFREGNHTCPQRHKYSEMVGTHHPVGGEPRRAARRRERKQRKKAREAEEEARRQIEDQHQQLEEVEQVHA